MTTEKTWTSSLIQHEDSDDLFFEIPSEVLDRMGWKIGDDVEFVPVDEHSFKLIKKQHDE